MIDMPADDPGNGRMDVDSDGSRGGPTRRAHEARQHQRDDECAAAMHGPPPAEVGSALLPGPLARSISFGTGTIRGAVRTARTVGRVPFAAARFTTSAGIEIGRQAFDLVLGPAGRTLYGQYAARGAAGDAAGDGRVHEDDARRVASVISSTFDAAHRGFHYLQLFTAAGFELTGSGAAALMDVSEVLLALVDSTLGSTESSRALRSIVDFLSREFANPATGLPGERVGVRDLLWGLCGLVYLQAACAARDDAERARLATETVVWDVVVLDGKRVDVHESSLYGMHRGSYRTTHDEDKDDKDDKENDDDDDKRPELLIRQQLLAAMSDAEISVSTSTAKIITVDITGTQPPPPISPPPGVELVELGPLHAPDAGGSRPSTADPATTYRIVFRINTGGPSTTFTARAAPKTVPAVTVVEQLTSDDETTAPLDKGLDKGLDKPLPERPTPSPASTPTSTPLAANQKRARQPAVSASRPMGGGRSSGTASASTSAEKKGSGIRNVLKRSNLLGRDTPQSKTEPRKPVRTMATVPPATTPPPKKTKTAPLTTPQMVRTPLTSRALVRHAAPTSTREHDSSHHRPRASITADDLESLASFASTFADSVSVHATRVGDEAEMQQTLAVPSTGAVTSRPGTARSHAKRASIYTLHTNDSQASLVVSAYGPGGRRGVAPPMLANPGVGANVHAGAPANPMNPGAIDTLDEVRRTGRVAGMFPARPLLHNLQRYMRFSSAAYGRDFLRAMGLSASVSGSELSVPPPHHHEIAAYARHTGVAPDDVLLASFIDAKGGPDAAGATRMPLVHYISLDHASRAVVLACRGTLGFEDILADMACAYDALYWRGRTYQVHKGIHASARRLLYGGDGRVLATLRDALLRHPEYGLVLCGHSLGASVTALLGVMLSEPAVSGCFQTKAMPPRLLVADASAAGATEAPSLPPGRPVHVFAYGPPGTMSPGLCKVTRGLVTSVVHGHDLVPFLSLGTLHDFQAVALAFKTDDSQASAELWGRLWARLRAVLVARWSDRPDRSEKPDDDDDDDAWAWAALKTLRASMLSPKLLPPGEVLVAATQRVLQRTAYAGADAESPLLMVSPAQRVVLTHVRDVEARFREIRFGLAAFADHSPGRYERALDQLVAGVV